MWQKYLDTTSMCIWDAVVDLEFECISEWQIKGNGLIFLEIDGYCKEYDLAPSESIVVDTGYLAAMSESCCMDVEMVKGAKNIFLGGEGLFHTRITGPGKVYIQSMPVINTAERLTPYIKVSTNNNNSNNGNGINIKFGD